MGRLGSRVDQGSDSRDALYCAHSKAASIQSETTSFFELEYDLAAFRKAQNGLELGFKIAQGPHGSIF